ncbi:MAG: DNA-binding response regulator [Bacteroidetes bacterium B1(2017)]|nr:MAG: DNA-binding response regulator [Bacteroidetes bacterium B1(2017)]OYU93615.1 MAG: DNA-binding response regulator [Bacteroidetes bacterium B1(2017)]
MLKAIAIDDEPMALEVIKAHANKVTFVQLKETFVSAMEALEYIKTHPVDLVFLDINMPDITGLDFSQLLPKSCGIIFTTAYSQYAADAFNLNAIDYLVKPFDFVRFMKACQKAMDTLSKEEAETPYLFVKDSYDLVRIVLADLLYVQSEGNYLTFKEKDKKTVTRMTMMEALELLPNKSFMRVNKSYVVNLNHIQKIERHQVSVAEKEFVPIAANYHSELMEALKQIWTVK